MFKFARDAQAVSAVCMRCGSGRTVVGRLLAEGDPRFIPRGLRWWKLSRGVPLLSQSVQGCLDCGCLVGSVDPSELRATIRDSGGDELRGKLTRSVRGEA